MLYDHLHTTKFTFFPFKFMDFMDFTASQTVPVTARGPTFVPARKGSGSLRSFATRSHPSDLGCRVKGSVQS